MSADISRDEQLRDLAAAFNEVAARMERIDGDGSIENAWEQLKVAEAHAAKLVKRGGTLGVIPWFNFQDAFPIRSDSAAIRLYAVAWQVFVAEWRRLAPDAAPFNPLALRPNPDEPGGFTMQATDWRIRRENSSQICRQVARMLAVSSQAGHDNAEKTTLAKPLTTRERQRKRIERVRELCREHSLVGQWAKLCGVANADPEIVATSLDPLRRENVAKMCQASYRQRGKSRGKLRRKIPRQ